MMTIRHEEGLEFWHYGRLLDIGTADGNLTIKARNDRPIPCTTCLRCSAADCPMELQVQPVSIRRPKV